MKKLLLFDLDGTLLTTDKKITDRTLRAIERARKKGYLIGVSTSRARKNAKLFLNQLTSDIFIASGGAIVTLGDDVIYEARLAPEECRYIVETANRITGTTVRLTIDTADEHYSNFITDHPLAEETWKKDIVTDFSKWDREDGLKIVMNIPDENKARELIDALPMYDSVRFNEENWYKFTGKNVTKETAIIKMCEVLGIDIGDITAFGDDIVDIGMLKLCGTGIAMANALKEVKEAADLVIGSNDEDGIAVYLEELTA